MKRNENNGSIKMILIIIFSFVMGGVITFGMLKYTPIISEVIGTTPGGGGTVVTKNETQVFEKSSLASSVEKIYNAVAVVRGYNGSDDLSSTGTAFVYKVDNTYGYLLTNQHVISEMKRITVTFPDEEEIEGTVLGGDKYLDLAVIRIDKKYVTLLANIGTSEKMKLGDTVFTVGSPMGYDYRGSVTAGILSGKDRMISVNVSNGASNDWVMRVLQLDAPINPGNSGGPLLNVNGEVIGICSMKLVEDEIEGMGFAIPIEYAMSHIDSLEKGKKIEWPLLGVTMVNVTETTQLYKENITIDKSIKEGVVVISTAEGTGAAKAGLKKGDIIIKLDKNKVKDTAYLRYELYQHQAGDTIEITYIRNGKEQTTNVTLSKNNNS